MAHILFWIHILDDFSTFQYVLNILLKVPSTFLYPHLGTNSLTQGLLWKYIQNIAGCMYSPGWVSQDEITRDTAKPSLCSSGVRGYPSNIQERNIIFLYLFLFVGCFLFCFVVKNDMLCSPGGLKLLIPSLQSPTMRHSRRTQFWKENCNLEP